RPSPHHPAPPSFPTRRSSDLIRFVAQSGMLDDVYGRGGPPGLSRQRGLTSDWIVSDEIVTHRYDVRRAAPTLFDRMGDRTRMLCREHPNPLGVGVPKAVDGLVIVSQYGEVRASGQNIYQGLVSLIQILKLVYKHCPIDGQHGRMRVCLEKPERKGD